MLLESAADRLKEREMEKPCPLSLPSGQICLWLREFVKCGGDRNVPKHYIKHAVHTVRAASSVQHTVVLRHIAASGELRTAMSARKYNNDFVGFERKQSIPVHISMHDGMAVYTCWNHCFISTRFSFLHKYQTFPYIQYIYCRKTRPSCPLFKIVRRLLSN